MSVKALEILNLHVILVKMLLLALRASDKFFIYFILFIYLTSQVQPLVCVAAARRGLFANGGEIQN